MIIYLYGIYKSPVSSKECDEGYISNVVESPFILFYFILSD